MTKRDSDADTQRGFHAGPTAAAPNDAGERDPRAIPSSASGQPIVEIEVVHSRGTAPVMDRSWGAIEIWTRNRIYTLDASLRCIEVLDRVSRQPERRHPLLAARLIGGQRAMKSGKGMELSHPFPTPGAEAVFEHTGTKRTRFSQTSKVVRVVLRLRVLSVAHDHLIPTWDEITGIGR